MRRRVGVLGAACLASTLLAGSSTPSGAGPSVWNRIADGSLRPTVMQVNGGTKTLPFFSAGVVSSLRESAAQPGADVGTSAVRGVSPTSLGCSERNQGRNVRVNQDCTYR